MKDFNGCVVVITGGTSGIGKATAELFAENGATVVVTGRNPNRGGAAPIIYNRGGNIEYVPCDVSAPDNIDSLKRYLDERYQRVDVLFNNAGIMPASKEMDQITDEEWKYVFQVNLDGVFYMTRALKELIFCCKGCIINNASIAGMQSYIAGRSYAYSASKSALIQLTRQMAVNYASDGVRVNAVCPGIIDTNILGDRDRAFYAKQVPLGYVAKPEEVAGAILFLASDHARYITGAVIPVDGGVSL